MNEPIAVRKTRFQMFLDQMSWEPDDVVSFLRERRQSLQLGGDDPEDEIFGVVNGRTLLTAKTATELAITCGDFDPMDLLGSSLNGEQVKIDEITATVRQKIADAERAGSNGSSDDRPKLKSIRELRGEALTKVMQQQQLDAIGVAYKRYPLPINKRYVPRYAKLVKKWADGKVCLPEDEIEVLAKVLGVDDKVISVRLPTEQEQSYLDRAAKRKKKTSKKKTSKPVATKKKTPSRPPRRGKSSGGIQFPQDGIADAVREAQEFDVDVDIAKKQVRVTIPLTLALLGTAFNLEE